MTPAVVGNNTAATAMLCRLIRSDIHPAATAPRAEPIRAEDTARLMSSENIAKKSPMAPTGTIDHSGVIPEQKAAKGGGHRNLMNEAQTSALTFQFRRRR